MDAETWDEIHDLPVWRIGEVLDLGLDDEDWLAGFEDREEEDDEED